MTVAHMLKNTGSKDIVTNVYCHNFLSLSPGDADIQLTAPFALTATKPLARMQRGSMAIHSPTCAPSRKVKCHLAHHRLWRRRG